VQARRVLVQVACTPLTPFSAGRPPLRAGRELLQPLILFPDTDFLFRRYQPSAHLLRGAGALKMSLLPFVGLTSPHSLHPLPPSQGGRGSG